MRYIIDGYNLIFQLYGEEASLQQLRQTLIEDLEEKAHLLQLHFIIVFDAHKESSAFSRSHIENVEIVYTEENQTADEYIVEIVRIAKSPRKLTIVTSDKTLATSVRAYYAHTEGAKAFFTSLQKRFSKRHHPSHKPTPFRKALQIEKEAPLTLKDPLFDFYMGAFEEPEKPSKPLPKKVYRRESDFDRWMRLFSKKSDSDKT